MIVNKHNGGVQTVVLPQLLHYFGGAALSWQWVTELLSDSFRCIAIDLPGFGNAAPLEHPSIEGFAAFVQDSYSLSCLMRLRYVATSFSCG
jgi:pimeloyl-ACP methyl ester carboxylesterase